MAHSIASATGEPEAALDHARQDDPCDLAPDNVVLLSTAKEGKEFVGLFELRLNTFAASMEPFTVAGTRGKKGFRVESPTADFEFRALTGTWRQPFLFWGDSFESQADRITVSHGGGRAKISMELPNPDIAAQAIEWRLILRSADNTQCLRSIPFRVVQSRGPVRGFASSAVPEQLKREKSTKPNDPMRR